MSLLVLAFLSMLLQQRPVPVVSTANPVIVFETEKGNIVLEVDVTHAPVTAANFLKYVDAGFYDGGDFHRTVRPDTEVRKDAPIQVIQAQINPERIKQEYPPIPIERTSVTRLRHRNGTVSMARDVTPTSPGPDTATSRIFICVGDQPSLDFGGDRSPDRQGFAAFGKVIEGMDVVERIHNSPVSKDSPATKHSAKGQTLMPVIKIIRAHRR
jgi:peptidyl-prolyl cis-trans isomerase A (cyclophilin A)